MFQPTLPHGERPAWRPGKHTITPKVSTHAPAWGATLSCRAWVKNSCVSTHAPAWGATRTKSYLTFLLMFQPTLPHGERRLGTLCLLKHSVSTHAPAWGATMQSSGESRISGVSTHAPAWGATVLAIPEGCLLVVSTHAPAWGATGNHIVRVQRSHCFNPRSRMGSDIGNSYIFRVWVVSTHAPAWGATVTGIRSLRGDRVSTHAPAWGATETCLWSLESISRFQPTLPHGERL